jgi:hypothetical protein
MLFPTMVYIPESPKFYYDHKFYDKAREILYKMAQRNNSKVSKEEINSMVFDVELIEIN